MKIAKIVKSNSHIDYVARIIDSLDVDNPPTDDDFGFAQFVSMPVSDAEEIIGVIYDSQLLNPEYGSFGPRLSPALDSMIFSPDYLNEQGLLVGILLLGWRDRILGASNHGIPRRIIAVNQDVFRLDDEAFCAFHHDRNNKSTLGYYSQLLANSGNLAASLMERIIENLSPMCVEDEQKRLKVLRQSLVWQRNLGTLKH